MKRLLSLTLAAALLAALTLPAAAAEETQDARLTRVTALVKETLALDTGAYESFRGNLSEHLVPVWDLSWEADRRSLSVSALEDGTVVSFYRWEYDPSPDTARTFPAFPERAGEADRAAARAFLSRVLREGETVELQEMEGGLSLRTGGSSWSGTISLNGLPSPLHYSIRVENGQVEHFDRDVPEAATVGGVPAPDPAADPVQAGADLEKTLKLQLEYVLEGQRAVLRYVPDPAAHDFLVDAKTGELLDLTELEERLSQGSDLAAGRGASNAPTAKAEMATDEAGLTQVEQEGIRQLEGVLSPESLDKTLRSVSAYGLRGYALTGSAYAGQSGKDQEEERILATLRYARTDGGERLTRNITVDAKTGEVESVWSSAPYGREKPVTEEEALKKAQAFLKTLYPKRTLVLHPEDAAIMPLGTQERPDWKFTFVQAVNGLPFPGNAVQIAIDGADGSLYALSSNWDGAVVFDSADGLISMETAVSAWAGTYESLLAYRNVPQTLSKSDPVQAKLLEQGMEYYHALRLTYGLEQEEAYSGVDAKTGTPVREESKAFRTPLTYQDLSGSPAKADIEKLAEYGAGYQSGKFRPNKNLTQWDLVCLVSSLQGVALDPENAEKDSRDSAYYAAFRMGLLRVWERDDGAVLSRADAVRMLLNAAGYGPAARLSGIYTCSYTDKASIPAEDLGYAALAQALGMAEGTFAGTRTATRGEAASMLCRVLEREL
ncbi:MAG: S-layer homology domain-containing protein [Oscillibacter sp.]|nr:S-layer homology domain-containing protein [Oscillibacter sp.]